jgi:aspartyl-tRNA(Asn)/glutamyl-tRNA(Gln) amidotransferase subunit A
VANDDIVTLDVAALSAKLRRKEISPVEVTDAYLHRIDTLNDRLKAYITVTADLAREQARAAEQEIGSGEWRGPLHGVPIALKDLCYTKGIRTTGGSRILGDFVPDYDSTVWTRLKDAGAVLLGKLNLHEFAYGITSGNPHWGVCRNPYDTGRIPGGSSGGSAAAIVAGLAAATIGSDTGGSIRIPAALCGCVGLKPTWSRVSRHGVIPLSYTLDHVGPITKTVRDAAIVLNSIAGLDPLDSTSSAEPVPDYISSLEGGVKGLRIGVIRELSNPSDQEVERAFKAALEQLAKLGAEIDEVSIPSLPMATMVTAIITWAEALEYHENWMATRPQDYGEDVRALLETGMATMATSYIRAQRARPRILAEALDALENRTVLVSPGAGTTAPKIVERLTLTGGGIDMVGAFLRFTGPFDVTGQPALALPTGLSKEGVPMSMQIVGRPFDEAAVLRVAQAYESARGPLPPPTNTVLDR